MKHLQVGDKVRLTTGWTRMVILSISQNGFTIAKYDKYPISEDSFRNPLHASGTQRRHLHRFTAWTGGEEYQLDHPCSEKGRKQRKKPMSQQYRTNHFATSVIGTRVGTAKNGDTILEMDRGGIEVFDPKNLIRVVPFTFQVKAVSGNGYRCNYTLAPGLRVQLNELLMSESGNLYAVIDVDTECEHPKGQFKGHRITKSEL